MKFIHIITVYLTTVILSLVAMTASAAVSITGTRVIYTEGKQEVSVKLRNNGSDPVILQSWIDDGDAKADPTKIKVPFSITPPMNRLDGGQNQTLRLVYTGNSLPTDYESVFWLNVLEIPATKEGSDNKNYLQMAFRTRIKLFFRPETLAGNPNDAVKELVWQATPNGIKAKNPTPYHISIGNVYLEQGGQEHKSRGVMVSPKNEQNFKFAGVQIPQKGNKIKITYINDFGALNTYETTLQ